MSKTIAIITGATGGVGREFTRQLLPEVDEIWAIARNKEKLSKLEEIYPDVVKGMSVDLSDEKNLEVISEQLRKGDYRILYLVNNAGAGRFAPSTDFCASEIAGHVTTHNIAMAVLCNICIPYMKRGSHIINTVSQASFQPMPYMNLYGACKAFNLSYSRALNAELKERGIKVTAVCPGWIKTNLLPETLNGRKVKFPHISNAKDVVTKALKDVRKGKEISLYGTYVNIQRILVRLSPKKVVMKYWMLGIKKYIS